MRSLGILIFILGLIFSVAVSAVIVLPSPLPLCLIYPLAYLASKKW